MVKNIFRRVWIGLIAVALICSALPLSKSLAMTEIKDDTDLSAVKAYQFSLKQENMEILSQSGSVVKDKIPANGEWKDSTVFSFKVKKGTTAVQHYPNPLSLKFNNAGTVYGKAVDVYVKFNNVDVHYSKNSNGDFTNPAKTILPFLTVDENWGQKSIQIMDYIYPSHPNLTNDIFGCLYVDADVTAEFKYRDGTPCDLKMVMFPSDVDVVLRNPYLKETFALYDINNSVDKKVMNNAYLLEEHTEGNKTLFTPPDYLSGVGTSGADEYNKAGLGVRSVNNQLYFSYKTTASCGGLFGFYTEVMPNPPKKAVTPSEIPQEAGREITYTTNYEMPRPGIDLIGRIDTLSMMDTFDDRLDFKSLEVKLEGEKLTENTDYTIEKAGQKVTVNIDKKHLKKGTTKTHFTIVYKTVTNNKIMQGDHEIKNKVTQKIDNVLSPSNEVKTEILYKKTHEFKSGTPGKTLPQKVLDLLPPVQKNIKNGTVVTPDQPQKNKVYTPEGIWEFKGYDKDSQTINNADAHFIGTWVLADHPKPKKDVQEQNGNVSINNKKVKPGDKLTYSISYTNTTGEERDVKITDTPSTFLKYIPGSASDGGKYENGTITWNMKVAPEKTVKVTFDAEVKDTVNGDVIENTGHVDDGVSDVDTNSTKNPTPEYISLPVQKKWIGKGQDKVTVKLFADNEDTGKTLELNDRTQWKGTFTRLLKKAEDDGHEIKYTVKENGLTNYSTEITGDATSGYVIKNTNTEKVSVPVMKHWIGKPADAVVIKLFADGVEKDRATLDVNGGWAHTFRELFKYDQVDGHEIDYTVREEPLENYKTGITGSAATGFNVTNTITGEVSVPVTKKWVGKGADSATIHLMADGREVNSVVLSEANQWQHTFAKLDKYDNGVEIKYTITEDEIENYKTDITGDATEGYTVKNTNIEKLAIPVTKNWIGKPAENIKVKLLADGTEKDSVVITSENNWTHTFGDLPKYDENDGHEIEYTLEEEKIDGYDSVITKTPETGFVITNTNTAKVNVPVQKKWEGKAKKSVEVTLLRDGKEIDKKFLSKSTDWKQEFKDLPVYDKTDGHEYVYAVKEKKIDGYKTSISGDKESGFVITNKEIIKPKTPVKTPVSLETGEYTKVMLYAGIMIVSGLILLMTLLLKKKNK